MDFARQRFGKKRIPVSGAEFGPITSSKRVEAGCGYGTVSDRPVFA